MADKLNIRIGSQTITLPQWALESTAEQIKFATGKSNIRQAAMSAILQSKGSTVEIDQVLEGIQQDLAHSRAMSETEFEKFSNE